MAASSLSRFFVPSGVLQTPGLVGQTLNREWDKRGTTWDKPPKTPYFLEFRCPMSVGQHGTKLVPFPENPWDKLEFLGGWE